jgi:hypothetical protein
VRAGSQRRRRQEPGCAAPYELAVGQEHCRERFVRVRRPMFHRVFLRGDAVVALPRPGTKTASAVAFELDHGREIEIAALPAEGAPGARDPVRLDYLSSPVGRGPSQLWLLAASSGEPVRTIELPNAISGVAEAPFGWYVGCRDGFLYALDRSGDLVWRWQTPGAAAFRSAGPGEVYFRPSPYRLASNGRSVLVSWWGSVWSVSPAGVTEWGLRLQDLSDRSVTEVRLRAGDHAAAAALGVLPYASPEEIKRPIGKRSSTRTLIFIPTMRPRPSVFAACRRRTSRSPARAQSTATAAGACSAFASLQQQPSRLST